MSRGFGQKGLRSGLRPLSDLREESVSKKTVSLQMRPVKTVSNWSVESGSTYVAPYDRMDDGIRRDVRGLVSVLDTGLTRKETKADVRSNAGSFFYDADEAFSRDVFRWDQNDGRWQVPAVDYNGSADYLDRASPLTDIADSKVGTLSFWFRHDAGASKQALIYIGTTQKFTAFRSSSSGIWRITGKNAGGSTILDISTVDGFPAGDGWHHLVAAWDLLAGTAQVYVDDIDSLWLGLPPVVTNDTLNYSIAGATTIGAFTGGGSELFDGALADIYFDPTTYHALNTKANRRKFILADGCPADLGLHGELPTGTSPILYLPKEAAEVNENMGTGGDFAINGAPAEAGVSPPDNAVHLRWDQFPQIYAHLEDASNPENTTVIAVHEYGFATEAIVHPDLGADKLTDGSFENWTTGDLDSWTDERADAVEETSVIKVGSSALELPLSGVQGRAIRLDGENDYYSKAATLSGAADGKQGLISCWLRLDGGDAVLQQLLTGYATADLRFRFHRNASNKLAVVAEDTSGNADLNVVSTTSYTASASWIHFLCSWSQADSKVHLYVTDSEDKGATTVTDDTLDYTLTSWFIAAATSGATPIDGAIAELYFTTEYLDLSVIRNRRKFIDANLQPAWLGTDASLPTGTAPLIYAPNGNPTTNAGTGGVFVANGSPTDVQGPGSPEVRQVNVPIVVGKDYRLSGWYHNGLSSEAQILVNHSNRFLREDGQGHAETNTVEMALTAAQGDWRRFAYDFRAVEAAARDFDGTNDYYARASDLIGIADGGTGMCSFWIRIDGGDGGQQYILEDANNRIIIERDASNNFTFTMKKMDNTTLLAMSSDAEYLATTTWLHVLAAWDLPNTVGFLYISDSADLEAGGTFTDDTIDYTSTAWRIGAKSDASLDLNAAVAEFWFAPGNYLDISSSANRRLFIDANGKPVYLGERGEIPLSKPPIIYLPDGDGTDNRGYGGAFTKTGNPLSVAFTPSAQVAVRLAAARDATEAAAAVTTPTTGAAGEKGADLDGSADYYSKGADLTGNADGQVGIFSGWVRIDGGDGGVRMILANTTPRFSIRIQGSNRLQFATRNSANTIIGNRFTTTAYTASASWIHFLLVWDQANDICALYVNDVADVMTGNALTDDTIDYTMTSWAVGSTAGGTNLFNGAITELYFAPNQFLDLSIEANRRLFIDANGFPVSLGADGSTPTGLQPLVYLPNGDATANQGSGGDFAATGTPTRVLGPAAPRTPATQVYFDDIKLQRIWRYDWFDPRIRSNSIPSVKTGSHDIFYGGKNIGVGSLSLINEDGRIEQLLAELEWMSHEVSVKYGGSWMPLDDNDSEVMIGIDDYQEAFTGLVQGFSSDDSTAKFKLQDIRAFFHRTVPERDYDDQTFTAMDISLQGKPRPIFFGTKKNITPARINLTGNGYGVYELADTQLAPNGIKAIDAVYAYDDETAATEKTSTKRLLLTTTTDYTEDLANGQLTIVKDCGPYAVTRGNNKLDFDEGGAEVTATLTVGLYTSAGLAAEVQTRLNEVGAFMALTCVYSDTTHKMTIGTDIALNLLVKTGASREISSWKLLGYDPSADLTGSTSYEAADALFSDPDAEHVLRVNAQGYKDDASGTYTGSANALINVGPDILRTLLRLFMRKPSSVIDETTFTNARSKLANVALTMYLNREQSTQKIFDILEFSTVANIVVEGSGKVFCKAYTGEVPSNTKTIHDRDIQRFSAGKDIKDIYHGVRIKYDRDPTLGTHESRLATDDAVKVVHGRQEIRPFETYIQSATTAISTASKMLQLAKNSARKVTLTTIGGAQMDVEVGDKVRVNRNRAVAVGGKIRNEVFRVLSVRKTVLKGTVDMELTDDQNTTSAVGCIGNDQDFCQNTTQDRCVISCEENTQKHCNANNQLTCANTQGVCSGSLQEGCAVGCENPVQRGSLLACSATTCQDVCERNTQDDCDIWCQKACESGTCQEQTETAVI